MSTTTIVSDFSVDSDGWQLSGDPTSTTPTYFASGGNTGGFIHGVDASLGADWYFSAPSKFLGNQSNAIGGTLKFDLRQRGSGSISNAVPNVILTGNNITLVINLPNVPTDPSWTSYNVSLNATAGWKIDALDGAVPTESEFQSVLSNLTDLQIRGEFIGGYDSGDLDNVVLEIGVNEFIGTALDDCLCGSIGNDIIKGLAGNDNLIGNSGDDNIAGSNGNDLLIGNAGNDFLTGDSGKDELIGSAGNDTLIGGKGVDQLVGGSGKDSFRFNNSTEGKDIISDFLPIDTIEIVGSGFGGLTVGVLPASSFVLGTTAQDTDDRFIYNQNTGALFFDSDGSGLGDKRNIAMLANKPTITAADIVVI